MLEDDLKIRIQDIYREYYQDVYHFLIYFTGNKDEAEDLTHDVFIQVLKSLPMYEGKSSLKTWIFAIAKHIAIDKNRRLKFRNLLNGNDLLSELKTNVGIPEELLQTKEESMILYESIQLLKPMYRAIIILRAIKQLSIKETAEILSVKESKVKVDYHRALQQLKKLILRSEKGVYAHEPAK